MHTLVGIQRHSSRKAITRLRGIRISVVVALAAGLALSPHLWFGNRLYPMTPVWPFSGPLPAPLDGIAFAAMFVLLGLIVFMPRPVIFIWIFIGLTLAQCLLDQSRWQPWLYQYLLMLAALGFSSGGAGLNVNRFIIAAIYFWSGLQKLNSSFAADVFPWMAPGLAHLFPIAGAVAPYIETAIGVALLTKRFRIPAMLLAIGMHLFILAALGPSGLASNTVVWPWNIAMIVFLAILFTRESEVAFAPIPRVLWPIVVLACIAPVLSLFDLWDNYLSWALYSGHKTEAVLHISDAVFDRLPAGIQDYVWENNELDIAAWSVGELNVAPYPEPRIYKNIAKSVCAYAPDGTGVTLTIRSKAAIFRPSRDSAYDCAVLP